MTLHTPEQAQATTEKRTITGGQLLEYVKRLLHQGNIRRIVISQEGRTIVEFPLTIGVVGAVMAPVLAAVGALAALLAECTIEIERVEETSTMEEIRPPTPAGIDPLQGPSSVIEDRHAADTSA
jgi:Domain of unknown function (DUF4342)